MSYGLNKVMLIGHLGQDPELKYTQAGVAVVSFSIATNESYKDPNGQMIDRTEWHRIVAWRKLAELFGQYLKKGSKIYLEGKLQTRSWEDNGVKKYTTEIVADDFVFLDSKGGIGSGSPDSSPSSSDAPPLAESEDDLPF